MALNALPDRPVDFDLLFRAYSRELNGFAYRRLNDREKAADLVQDGFVRTFAWHRKNRKVLGAADGRFLLWSVVGHLITDAIRQRRVRGVAISLDDVGDVADTYPTQDRFIEGRQAYGLFRQALEEAPVNQSTALLMSRIGGLTHNEIAERLGVSPSMVSKYIMAVMDRIMFRLAVSRR
jgi:RNA polymerase sigma factor (sigma-70 family)